MANYHKVSRVCNIVIVIFMIAGFVLPTGSVVFADDKTPPIIETQEPMATVGTESETQEPAATAESEANSTNPQDTLNQSGIPSVQQEIETPDDVLAVVNDGGVTLVDEIGNPISLGSTAAIEAIENPDPYFVDSLGVTHHYLASCAGVTIDALNTCTETPTPVQDAINAAPDGGSVYVGAGVFNEAPIITRSMSLIGAGIDTTIFRPSNPNSYGYGLSVIDADQVTLSNFTLDRSLWLSTATSYGIHVDGYDVADGFNQTRAMDISIKNVKVTGNGGTGVDVNGVDGLTFNNVTVQGPAGGRRGNGFSLTDVENASLSNLYTANNNWGGLAIYSSGAWATGGSNNIILDGVNSFNEVNKVYSQAHNGYEISNFTAGGFDYAYGNLSPIFTGYLFYTQDKDGAVNHALATGAASAYIRQLNDNKVEGSDLYVAPGLTIQAAIDAANTDETILVAPGSYNETATNRRINGAGPYQFGLFIGQDKSGLTIQGLKEDGTYVTDWMDTQAFVTTNATNSFGYSGIFVEGDNVTINGLQIGNNIPGNNKTLEVIGDNFSFINNQVLVDEGGSLYFNDWNFNNQANTSHIQSYIVDGNYFSQGATVDLTSGTGYSGSVVNRQITNNLFDGLWGEGGESYWAQISFNGSNTGVPWFVQSVGGAVITGNTFQNGELYIRTRGTYVNSQFDWKSFWCDNNYDHAAVTLADVPTFDVRSYSYSGYYGQINDVRRIGGYEDLEQTIAQTGDLILTPGLCEELGICDEEPVDDGGDDNSDQNLPDDGGDDGVIPVTGGVWNTLSCTVANTLELADKSKVVFTGILCDYNGRLQNEPVETLPAAMPDGATYINGLTYELQKDGVSLDRLVDGVKAQVSFPMPTSEEASDFKILHWDILLNGGVGGWAEMPGVITGDGFVSVITDLTGTFILIN